MAKALPERQKAEWSEGSQDQRPCSKDGHPDGEMLGLEASKPPSLETMK